MEVQSGLSELSVISGVSVKRGSTVECSLIPRPPSFFVHWVVYITLKWKSSEKQGRLGNFYHLTWCEMDVGGLTKNTCSIYLRENFLLVKQSARECLESCLVLEHSMMKSSTLYLNVDPSPPTSTSRPPDVFHVISNPRLSPYFAALSLPCIIPNQRTTNKKIGEAWNEAIQHSNTKIHYRKCSVDKSQ